MKKTVLCFAVMIGAMMVYAVNSYLYFQVDQTAAKNPIAFEYARIGVDNVMDYLNAQGTSSSWLVGESQYKTGLYYVDMGNYDSSIYSFFVELYDNDFASVGKSALFGYDELTSFIATDMGQGGVTSAWTVSKFDAMPEPTTGMLMLMGIGVLALRRKRHIACVMLLSLGLNVLADANDTLITFSTVGPDKYADGSVIKDGECYALVWVKNGVPFAGFAADGKLIDETNSVLLLTAPIAQGGRCPTTCFEINAMLSEKYTNGEFDVYLLDTRMANGTVGGVLANGHAVAVNGYGKVDLTTCDGKADVKSQSLVPADVPQPVIKAMKVVGGNVYLTVAGTVPYLQYKPIKIDFQGRPTEVKANSVQGVLGEDIIIIAPVTGKSGFYKVGRN